MSLHSHLYLYVTIYSAREQVLLLIGNQLQMEQVYLEVKSQDIGYTWPKILVALIACYLMEKTTGP